MSQIKSKAHFPQRPKNFESKTQIKRRRRKIHKACLANWMRKLSPPPTPFSPHTPRRKRRFFNVKDPFEFTGHSTIFSNLGTVEFTWKDVARWEQWRVKQSCQPSSGKDLLLYLAPTACVGELLQQFLRLFSYCEVPIVHPLSQISIHNFTKDPCISGTPPCLLSTPLNNDGMAE
ncbi:uncharacterized protein NPIL_387021 [Nephila pilipes]|uniref:Uncharacterized protein n=1 Tax=Nephila pilipes TaxID=299642 RepID=A0A8X6Q2A4_NEPPI|nr:uncharacterized protein NPIL_387021 [Nephila pilipes]